MKKANSLIQKAMGWDLVFAIRLLKVCKVKFW